MGENMVPPSNRYDKGIRMTVNAVPPIDTVRWGDNYVRKDDPRIVPVRWGEGYMKDVSPERTGAMGGRLMIECRQNTAKSDRTGVRYK